MNSQFLQSNLGKRYKIYTDGVGLRGRGAVVNHVKPIVFSDHIYAKQFIRSLKAPPSLWRSLASSQVTPSHGDHDADIEHVVSQLFISGKVKLYEVPSGVKGTAPKSQKDATLRGKLTYEFTSAASLLVDDTKPVKGFSSLKEASKFVDDLGAEEAELKGMLGELGFAPATRAPYSELVEKLANVIYRGQVVALVNTPKAARTSAPVEISSPAPQSPSLGPTTSSPKPGEPIKEEANAEAEQAKALEQAAEEGAPFCEECEKARQEQEAEKAAQKENEACSDGAAEEEDGGNNSTAVSATPVCDEEPEEEPKKIEGKFDKETARCGDEINLIANSTNIPDGGKVTYSIRSLCDSSTLESVEGTLSGSSSTDCLVVKKASGDWEGADFDFKLDAAGVSGTSSNQFTVEKYEDIAVETKTFDCRSRGASGTRNYRWKGAFDAESKDGLVTITTKIKLLNRSGAKPTIRGAALPAVGTPVSDTDKAAMKADIESKLSAKSIMHRDDCSRGSTCDCSKDYGCCKQKVKVVVEFVESGQHHEVNLFQGAGRANASNWTRVKTRANSWAHETGHLLGWFDEYSSGAIGSSPRWKNSNSTAVMSTGLVVPAEYYWDFRDWLKGKTGEDWELIS